VSWDVLKDVIDRARDLLDNTVVSEDGEDVPIGTYWATQAAHDGLQAAIDLAEAFIDANM